MPADGLCTTAARFATEFGGDGTSGVEVSSGTTEEVAAAAAESAERGQAPDPSDMDDGAQKRYKDRPSVKMKTFLLDWAMPAWRAMFARDGPPEKDAKTNMAKCTSCKQTAKDGIFYRCTQCVHGWHLCAECCVKVHTLNPLHVIEEWDDRRGFWLKVPLADLGLVIDLGHAGENCPETERGYRKIVMIHEHGIQEVKMRFCRCLDSPEECIQLIEVGFWPGSWKRPETAMTLQVMHQYQLLSAQAQVSARDFYDYLRRLTNNTCSQEVPDRYRQFMTSCREFTYIKLCKYFGVQPDEHMEPASLAVRCPACPQPGINMHPRAKTRPANLQFLDALFHAVDGNFSQSMKNKSSDVEDFPLISGGSGYFAYEKDVQTYLRNVPKGPREPTTCHKFGALGYYGHWGSVSGTIGMSCARHMFLLPGGSVDLEKGERFANVDVAMLCGLQLWMELPLFVSAYDINCQYRINFGARMEAFRKMTNDFTTIRRKFFPRTLPGVGKFHLPAHIAHCRFKFSFNYLPGVGMTDGEAPERVWSVYNGLANRTREMSKGHRHDVQNFFLGDLNVRRMNTLAHSLSGKWERTVEFAEKTEQYIVQLEEEVKGSEVMGEEMLDEWKRSEEEWLKKVVDMKKHEGLENLYEIKEEHRLSRDEMWETLSKEARDSGYAEGVVGTIEEGIKLQEIKAVLLQELDGDETPETLPASVQDHYTKFAERVEGWRAKAVMYLAPMVDEAAMDLSDEDRKTAAESLAAWTAVSENDEEVAEWDPVELDGEQGSEKRRRVGEPEAGVPAGKANTPAGRRTRRKATVSVADGVSTSTPTALSEYLPSERTDTGATASSGERRGQRKRTRDEGIAEGGGGTSKKAHSEAWHEVNNVKIELPSSHDPLIREHKALGVVVKIEESLRKLQAADALDNLRTLLITSYGLNADRRKLSGQKSTTRALNALKRTWLQIRVAAGEYRRVREILVKLGMSEDDRTFRPLKREDVKAFVVISGEEQLGDSKRMPSWIWENIGFLKGQGEGKVKEYCIEAYRVHWFRMHALSTRWWEEKQLVPEEMWRTIAYFRYFEDWWGKRATELAGKGEEAQAAYSKKQAYRFTTLLHGCHIEFRNGPAMAVEAINVWYDEHSGKNTDID